MQAGSGMGGTFDVVVIGQKGRLEYEVLLFAASLRRADPGFEGRLIVAEPAPGPMWAEDPRMADPDVRAELARLDAEILTVPARFGDAYPQGTRADALSALPPGRPFLCLDSDSVVLAPLDLSPGTFATPTASMRRENTWPVEELYGPTRGEVWRTLYDRAGLDLGPTLDTAWPDRHWERYLYLSAAWTLGPCPATFGALWARRMAEIDADPGPALACQPLRPWLDQAVLPLVVTELGGGRPGPDAARLDGGIACHWRVLPLAYAREDDRVIAAIEETAAPNRIKRILKRYEPMRRTIYQGRGARARRMFDRANLPPTEAMIRKRLKRRNLWMR